MAEEENVSADLLEIFISQLELEKESRQEELKTAIEMRRESMHAYLTGRRDEIDRIIGEAYKFMFNNSRKRINKNKDHGRDCTKGE